MKITITDNDGEETVHEEVDQFALTLLKREKGIRAQPVHIWNGSYEHLIGQVYSMLKIIEKKYGRS